MNRNQAEQIANLLNTQNQLDHPYDADMVLNNAKDYRFLIDDDQVLIIAAVEIKRIQWYQSEILHLSVSPQHQRKGLGRRLLADAEADAKGKGDRILQCTIREDNVPSKKLFQSAGFTCTSTFHNARTGNNVTVWQKVVCEKK
jgi:ribosomal protein S18 acetylase RimI-like enzyme